MSRWRRAVGSRLDRMGLRGVVLVYHEIGRREIDPWQLTVSPENLIEHVEAVAARWPVIPQGRIADQDSGDAAFACFTFDDGYMGVIDHALPAFANHRLPATVFLNTAALGTAEPYWWDELADQILGGTLPGTELSFLHPGGDFNWRPGDSDADRLHLSLWRVLRSLAEKERGEVLAELRQWSGVARNNVATVISPDDVVEMSRHDLIEIGSHTDKHSWLPGLTLEDRRRDIHEGKELLEAITGAPVLSFAYPFGGLDRESVQLVRESGFRNASQGSGRVVTRWSRLFRLPRLHVTDCSGDELIRRLIKLGMP